MAKLIKAGFAAPQPEPLLSTGPGEVCAWAERERERERERETERDRQRERDTHRERHRERERERETERDRERQRERERERKMDQLPPASRRHPNQGSNPQPFCVEDKTPTN